MKSILDSDGFFLQTGVISQSEVASLVASCSTNSSEAGSRNLLTIPQVRALACSAAVRGLVKKVLGENFFAVRAIFFDKSPEANWKVTWHQDLTIAVKSQKESPGYGPWSVKDDVVHVQPPNQVLEQMLAVRVHLDDCNAENGPLRVIPSSHRHGKLSPDQIHSLRSETPEKTCLVPSGGVLLMRSLLLHASSKATSPTHRRVVHLEFAATELASDLEWYEKIF
jgi:ectoine hydroxylase-related dioxygenase (phytanoyl-CoA dioxygenase family)